MRFEFCGELDCPDWVLAQIQLLSRLSSVKLKVLVSEVIRMVLQDEVKIQKLESVTGSAKFDEGDVRAVTAAIDFIVRSGAKNNTNSDVLSDELQQLGLPREHAIAFCRQFGEKKDSLRSVLRNQSLRLCGLEDVSVVHRRGVENGMFAVDMPFVELSLCVRRTNGKTDEERMCLTKDDLNDMISQLQEVRELMTSIK